MMMRASLCMIRKAGLPSECLAELHGNSFEDSREVQKRRINVAMRSCVCINDMHRFSGLLHDGKAGGVRQVRKQADPCASTRGRGCECEIL